MPKKASMYLLDRTTHAKVLVYMFLAPWVGFYKSDTGIRKILIFAKVTGQNSSKMAAFSRLFFACKIGKNQMQTSESFSSQ